MNCKPGDLAYIAIDAYPDNIGRVVQVVRLVAERSGLQCWWVQCNRPLAGIDSSNGKFGYRTEGSIPDAYLRPISGVPVADEEHEEVPREVIA